MYIFFVPHKYPVEVVVLCPDVETIKGRERY
ncbi:phosphotransferase, partial [human gut metagenome]